jgi:hypothetical protein
MQEMRERLAPILAEKKAITETLVLQNQQKKKREKRKLEQQERKKLQEQKRQA